jgi:hypothetical protein
LRERCRKLGRPDETAGEYNDNRRCPEDRLTDMPDPITEEYPSAPGRNHGECVSQPIEKPFSIETKAGEFIVVVVNPAGLGAEVPCRSSGDIELDHCLVIPIAGRAIDRG